MRYLPETLLVLSLPVGALGIALTLYVLSAVAPDLAHGVVGLFLPLLVGGLFMLPFLVPFFDRKAKEDLAAHRSAQEASDEAGDEPDA
jgi:hypothetical protein